MKIAGSKVVYADKPLTLIITSRDCTLGNTKDPSSCAAARCIKRQLHVADARVHIGRTYVKSAGRWVRYKTSQALRAEIISFDRGGKFMPGEYTLLPISAYDRDRFKPTGPKLTKGQPRRKLHIVAGIRPHGANK